MTSRSRRPFSISFLPLSAAIKVQHWLNYGSRRVELVSGPGIIQVVREKVSEDSAESSRNAIVLRLEQDIIDQAEAMFPPRNPPLHASDVFRDGNLLRNSPGEVWDYDSLRLEHEAKRLWKWALALPWDSTWWEHCWNTKAGKAPFSLHVEKLSECLDGCETLGADHFLQCEVQDERRPFVLDKELLRLAEASQDILVVIARAPDGTPLGYATWQLCYDCDSRGLLYASQGAWYARKSAPHGIAKALFSRSLHELRVRAVKRVLLTHRDSGRGRHLARFFQNNGASLLQHTYAMWI